MKKTLLLMIAVCFALALVPSVWAEGNDQYTVLLIQSDNSDGDVSFLDSSVGGESHSVTALGDVHHSTGQAKLGGSSLAFDGNGDSLTLPDSDDWNFGSDDFTIDGWIKYYDISLNEIVGQWYAGNLGTDQNGWGLGFYANAIQFAYSIDGVKGFWFFPGWSPTLGEWHHIALVRSGSLIKFFADGIQTGGDYTIGSDIIFDAIGTLNIGGSIKGGYANGFIDELRISKGIARWTTDFTPPTEPYSEPTQTTPLAISSVFGTPVSGIAPLSVDFTISASGGTEPYYFEWDFGDGTTSADQNPTYTYTSPGAYSVQVIATDADGNTATDSVVITVQSDASTCATHAVFDSSTKVLTVPYLDVPLIDPISQQEIPGSDAVFSCTMKYMNHSGGSFSIQDVTYLPNEIGDDCHAKYDYDGTIYIPNVDVTTVIVLPWGNIIEGPVETYQVALKQLMLDNKYYHLTDAVMK